MRFGRPISIGLFAVTFLAISLYAYRSWSGLLTLTAVAAAALVGLVIASVAVARLSGGRPRIGLAIILATIGTVAFSWNQLMATADADKFRGELAAAADGDVYSVIAETRTDTGSLVRDIVEMRGQLAAAAEPLLADLWNDDILTIVTGRDAEDDARLAAAMEIAGQLTSGVEAARNAIEAEFEITMARLAAIATPLPESKRLSVLLTAQRQIQAQRDELIEALDLTSARLEAGRRAASILTTFPLNYRYDRAQQTIVFDTEGVRIAETIRQYHLAIETLNTSGVEITSILQNNGLVGFDEIMALANAALAPP